jgi:hypothetical protein
MSHPALFLLCASAAALTFGAEPSGYLAARAQVADIAAPSPKFHGAHRVRPFRRAPIRGAPHIGISTPSRGNFGAIEGVGGAADVGGPALNEWRYGREIGGVPDVGGPALNGGFGGMGGPDVGGPALNGGLIGGPPRIGAPALGSH